MSEREDWDSPIPEERLAEHLSSLPRDNAQSLAWVLYDAIRSTHTEHEYINPITDCPGEEGRAVWVIFSGHFDLEAVAQALITAKVIRYD